MHPKNPTAVRRLLTVLAGSLCFSPGARRMLIVLCGIGALQAQSGPSGTIKGQVRQNETGAYLEGAEITLVERNTTTVSGREGDFEFAGLPVGAYVVRIVYTGLEPKTVPVEVAAGQVARTSVALTAAQAYQMDKFVIAGTREGNAAAITRQRIADNVMNVVSTDAYGNVADGNIGNFMQRLPGISTVVEQGDIVGINIRGTPSELNSFNVDGTRAANAYGGFNPQGDRGAAIDQIPAEFIKEIEVVKGLTPDFPADSVGGTVNLVTKSALDYNRPITTFRVGANQNTYRETNRRWTPTGAFSHLTRLGREQNIGLAFSTSYSGTTNTRERMTTQRIEATSHATSASALDDIVTRVRAGVALKFNYRINDNAEAYSNFQHNYFSFHSVRSNQNFAAGGGRRVASYAAVSRAQIEAGAVPRTTTQTAGVAPGFTDTLTELLAPTYLNRAAAGERHSWQYKFEVGANQRLAGNQKISFQLSYNPTTYRNTFQGFDLLLNGRTVGVAIDSRASRSPPIYYQTYGPSIGLNSDLSLFRGQRFYTPENSEEEIGNLRADYEKLMTFGNVRLTLKAGFNWRQQHRVQSGTATTTWDFVGADGVFGLNGATGRNDDNLGQFLRPEPGYTLFNNLYPKYDQVDYEVAKAAFYSNPSWYKFLSATPEVRNELTEDVYAGYVMGTLRFKRFTVLGGTRVETTELEATGGLTDPRQPGTTSTSVTGDYRKLFPSVHLRYEPARGAVLRASYSSGYGRASFADIYPTTTVTYNNSTGLGQVNRNDSAIKPQYSRNYDVSAEYYFEPAGVLSAGYFYKRISDFIGDETRTVESGSDNGFDGNYSGFDLITTRNFGRATIKGFEVAYTQRLQMLPRPLNTLALFANYTRLKTEGSYAAGAEELVRFVPETSNVGVSFDWRKVELRATYNYKGSFLNTYNALVNSRQRVDDVDTWDFNLQYRLRSNVKVFIDVINAFNKWPNLYTGADRQRVQWSEGYGSRINLGLSGRF